MKPILLALANGVLAFALTTIAFRFSNALRSAKTMLKVYLLVTIVLFVSILATPPDLGFLFPDMVTPSTVVDAAFALFLYTSGFFGGLLQLYNLAERGFSLRILIDAVALQSDMTSVEQVCRGYSAGKGIEWMYDKRIDGMLSAGLVRLEGQRLELTDRGMRAAAVFGALREFTRQPAMAPGRDI
jgi:hypothetical protein